MHQEGEANATQACIQIHPAGHCQSRYRYHFDMELKLFLLKQMQILAQPLFLKLVFRHKAKGR